MSTITSLLVLLLLAFDLKSSSAYICRWRTVGIARSLLTNSCLRLSVKSCDCTGPGCPGKYYTVEEIPESANVQCPAVITWCTWAPWSMDIQTSRASTTGCEKVSIRQRVCCIKDNNGVVPTHSTSKYWGCPTNIAGDKQIVKRPVSCPTRDSNLSVVFISLIVCLFFITVIIVIVRIFFYKRITAYFQRNNTRGVAPHHNQHLSHNFYLNQGQTSPPDLSDITTPPTYTEAMNQMPKPPSYDEIVSNSNVAENAPPQTQSESVAATTCSTQNSNNTNTNTTTNNNINNNNNSNNNFVNDNCNNDNLSCSRRDENATPSSHGRDTSC